MLDIILNPYVKETKSFVWDMTDFINKISKIDDLGDDDWIFSMDVTGLYTNISTAEGIDTIWQIIKDRCSNPPNSRIIEILKFVLKHNNFKFNGTNFLQLEGTAMGTRVAPTYANLFMSQFESKHIYQYEKAPLFWLRFIDDIWGVFRGTESDFLKFITYCNSVHDTIKFTVEYSKQQVTFSAVITYRHANRIFTNLFEKPTNSHSYLSYDSCHPISTKNSIPFSQFMRV